MPRIAVIAPPTSWHYRDLVRAADDNTSINHISFATISAAVSNKNPQPFVASGRCHLNQYDCLLARTMASGSLEQVVFRMDALGALHRDGHLIVNCPKAIEISIDKYHSLQRMAENKIRVPKTYVSQTTDDALEHFEMLNRKVVVKPIFGSMGRGVMQLASSQDASEYFTTAVNSGAVIYQQEFLEHRGFDLRLLVIGQRVIGMKRSNPRHWVTNINRGGTASSYEPTELESRIAFQAAKAVGAQIAGVDLLYQVGDSHPFVLEVNAAPGWNATQTVTGYDVAQLVLNELNRIIDSELPRESKEREY